MAYFLKKAKQGKRTYLQIYESYYSSETKGTKHRCIKSMGSVESLLASGIEDPIEYCKKQVDLMNQQRNDQKSVKKIDISPIRHLGYFPIESIMNKMSIKQHIDFYKLVTDFDFDLYEVFSSLIFSRLIKPCSKSKTFSDVIPLLFSNHDFSYGQLMRGLAFLGNDYQKIIELFTTKYQQIYNYDTSHTYFDCTNFFFEIDREDDFRKKGPSKEKRHDPIVGMGLLLDANQVPIGMKLYPGNQSEKPIMRDILNELKKTNNINGKTIHVADKGLNCAENILNSKKNGDGYIFSKSVKNLPETEKEWILLTSDYIDVKDSDGNVKYRYKTCIDEFEYSFKINGKTVKKKIKEKRLITYNPTLAKKQTMEINKLIEKARELSYSKAKKSEYGECSKYVKFSSVTKDGEVNDEKPLVTIDETKIEKDKALAGYNLLVTSELDIKDEELYKIYHNLWRIEESFRIMKSDLDARPVYVKVKETIQGHFLICYLCVMLIRILQLNELNNKYNTNEIFEFIREFKVIKAENKYVNLTSKTKFITEFATKYNLPLTNYYLSDKQIKMVLDFKI